jgi:pentatricopeptide repeat protein
MVVSLAKTGQFKEARVYLKRMKEHTSSTFYAEAALSVLAGESPAGSNQFETFLADSRGSTFSRGELCFIAGDVQRGCAYWKNLRGRGLTRHY